MSSNLGNSESTSKYSFSDEWQKLEEKSNGAFIEYEGVELRVFTGSGNPSVQMHVLGEEEYGIPNPYGLSDTMRARNKLKERDVLDSEDNLVLTGLREPIREFFSVHGSERVHKGPGSYSKDTQRDVARMVDQSDQDKSKARFLVSGTDYDSKLVGRVLGYWGEEYGLDEDEYISGNSNATSWNLGLLEDEGIIDDLLEE